MNCLSDPQTFYHSGKGLEYFPFLFGKFQEAFSIRLLWSVPRYWGEYKRSPVQYSNVVQWIEHWTGSQETWVLFLHHVSLRNSFGSRFSKVLPTSPEKMPFSSTVSPLSKIGLWSAHFNKAGGDLWVKSAIKSY